MAKIVSDYKGRKRYVLLRDEHDIQAAKDLGKEVDLAYLYNVELNKRGDVVGPFYNDDEVSALQQKINTNGEKLRVAARDS